MHIPNSSVGSAVLCMLASLSTVQAHTWLEQLRLIASNGTFVGAPGYGRAFVPRDSDPNGLSVYKLLNNLSPDKTICSERQKVGAQAPGFPRLRAAPGDQIAMQYLENGHVTRDREARPAGGGTVFVYGTKDPRDTDTYLGIHRQWNIAGTGGDKRGKLLATRPYDDGQCYQVNGQPLSVERQAKFPRPTSEGNADLPCQTDLQLPTDAGTSGQYTLYWVWEWPLLVPNPANETYTACVDIDMTDKKISTAGAFIDGQPVNQRAIAAQLKDQFLMNPTAPLALTSVPFTKIPSATADPSSQGPALSSSRSPSGTTSTTVVPQPSAAPGVTVTVTTGQGQQMTVTVTDTVIMDSTATRTPTKPSTLNPIKSNTAPIYTSLPTSIAPFIQDSASSQVGDSQPRSSSTSKQITSTMLATPAPTEVPTSTAPAAARQQTSITGFNGTSVFKQRVVRIRGRLVSS